MRFPRLSQTIDEDTPLCDFQSGRVQLISLGAMNLIVLVTAPDLKVARKLAKAALESHLAACANLVPNIESHYWWQDRLESSSEVLVIFKTTGARLKELEACVLKNHPYDTPEFLVLSRVAGNARYLRWLSDSVKKHPGRR